jgi:hypothetical protein
MRLSLFEGGNDGLAIYADLRNLLRAGGAHVDRLVGLRVLCAQRNLIDLLNRRDARVE